MPRHPKAKADKYKSITISVRPEDVDVLKRLTLEVFHRQLGGGGAEASRMIFDRGERPSVSSAIRYLIDREIERRRGGDGKEQASLWWLQTGSYPEGYDELSLAEGGQRHEAIVQGKYWKIYGVKKSAEGRPIYIIQWIDRGGAKKTIFQEVQPGDMPYPPGSELKPGEVPELPGSTPHPTISSGTIPGEYQMLGSGVLAPRRSPGGTGEARRTRRTSGARKAKQSRR